MSRGKKESNRPGGVTRNDHHRRNRKRNISTHCHSHGFQTGIQGIRVIKRPDLESLILKQINEREKAAFHMRTEVETLEEDAEIPSFFNALSALHQTRFLYLPPFLKPGEIVKRRFGESPSDRWWEWEEELGISSDIGRPVAADDLEMKQPLRW